MGAPVCELCQLDIESASWVSITVEIGTESDSMRTFYVHQACDTRMHLLMERWVVRTYHRQVVGQYRESVEHNSNLVSVSKGGVSDLRAEVERLRARRDADFDCIVNDSRIIEGLRETLYDLLEGTTCPAVEGLAREKVLASLGLPANWDAQPC